jgi:hypothetical protein
LVWDFFAALRVHRNIQTHRAPLLHLEKCSVRPPGEPGWAPEHLHENQTAAVSG